MEIKADEFLVATAYEKPKILTVFCNHWVVKK